MKLVPKREERREQEKKERFREWSPRVVGEDEAGPEKLQRTNEQSLEGRTPGVHGVLRVNKDR